MLTGNARPKAIGTVLVTTYTSRSIRGLGMENVLDYCNSVCIRSLAFQELYFLVVLEDLLLVPARTAELTLRVVALFLPAAHGHYVHSVQQLVRFPNGEIGGAVVEKPKGGGGLLKRTDRYDGGVNETIRKEHVQRQGRCV